MFDTFVFKLTLLFVAFKKDLSLKVRSPLRFNRVLSMLGLFMLKDVMVLSLLKLLKILSLVKTTFRSLLLNPRSLFRLFMFEKLLN